MPSHYEVTAEINGIKRTTDIVANEKPTYEKLQNRIDKAFNIGKKDTIKNVRFKMIKEKLGL